MSSQTFSRSFLQGMPEQRKQQNIDKLIEQFVQDLQRAAASGKTSYMYSTARVESYNSAIMRPNGQEEPVITNDDLISAFQRKFPDCRISYEETWVERDSNTKYLTKGIIIDWS